MSESNYDLQPAFVHGELELKGQFMLGSNYTFLVTVRHDGTQCKAVYKPCEGEQPLWDFPANTLAQREVAAYLVSEALGWHFVPYTTLRNDGPYGPGSLQQFIEYDPRYHYFTFTPDDRARLRPVALFDLLVNNADRKGSHLLIEKGTNKLWVIDHGICFHEQDKLRTVIWDFAGQPIPDDLLAAVSYLRSNLAGTLRPPHGGGQAQGEASGLRADLGHYLSPGEISALEARAEAVLTAGAYPSLPGDRRAFPYPPI